MLPRIFPTGVLQPSGVQEVQEGSQRGPRGIPGGVPGGPRGVPEGSRDRGVAQSHLGRMRVIFAAIYSKSDGVTSFGLGKRSSLVRFHCKLQRK